MTSPRRVLILLVAAIAVGFSVPRAQMRVVPIDEEQGHIALGLALRHLGNAGIFMMATAHPDDENNGLLVMLNRGQGYRTALATATRGNGGQNEIGPELFEALGVLRTEELAALHRFDGAEQYFTRAVDFGYSFSIEETFDKWGREEILSDYVRLIRMIRPDVITALSPGGDGGGQHHQASAILAREAFKAAGDPAKYPEQLKDGLRVWQPKKFYFSVGFASGGLPAAPLGRRLSINLSGYDALLGKTYAEIGTEARSMHKCQGMAQLLSLPGPASTAYELVESVLPGGARREDGSLFDGVDTSLAGLAQFAGSRRSSGLTQGLAAIAADVARAQKQFDSDGDAAVLAPVLDGLRALRALRAQLPALGIDEAGRFEIDYRLAQKEREFEQAALLANGVRVEALADDGVVVPGQPLRVTLLVANHGPAGVAVASVKFDGLDGDARCTLTPPTAGGGRGRGAAPPEPPAAPMSSVGKDQVGRCEPTFRVPQDARITEPYWHRQRSAGRYTFDPDAPFGLPYRPTPFAVRVTLGFPDGTEVVDALPIQYRYGTDIFAGEKRTELLVVPALSVRTTPDIAIVATGGAAARPAAAAGVAPRRTSEREIRVTVVNDTRGEAATIVTLQLPKGWTSAPLQQPLTLTREDEAQTVRFVVRPPANVVPGEYPVAAVAATGSQTFTRGYEVIEYPHIRRQHIYDPAVTRLKAMDVKVAPGVSVGYIMGVGDQVPPAIAQLGVKVEMISADDLAWGDLSRFSTIVTGVRAYERRADLRANNARLLEYVRNGGTLLVQYNKFEFNQAQYGPYPAKVSADRVTDEDAPVTMLAAGDTIFSSPNKIGPSTWRGWVQERGLYFLGDRDPRYRDLVSLEDPFPYNSGEKRGALVVAQYGKGRWIYIGLGLWRELPAGVDGAYQLLANLVSLNR